MTAMIIFIFPLLLNDDELLLSLIALELTGMPGDRYCRRLE